MNKIEELLLMAKQAENEAEIEQFCEVLAQLEEHKFEQFFVAWDAESEKIRDEAYELIKNFKISQNLD
ncbi:MAG: hypothetical protein MUE85_00585 [Microscillaceae bacterium]|jgi:hypothetical protein|nr:hypothetical protein [Microscillaceae bacterium]